MDLRYQEAKRSDRLGHSTDRSPVCTVCSSFATDEINVAGDSVKDVILRDPEERWLAPPLLTCRFPALVALGDKSTL